jgi:hypothetical protein
MLLAGCVSPKEPASSHQAEKPVGQAHTPAKGTAERTAILAGVHRAMEKQDPAKKVVLVVKYLKVHNGWAWIQVAPQSPDGTQHYEDQSGLLRKEGAQWSLLEWMPAEEGTDATAYFKDLKKKYPAAPTDIFPT